MGEAVETVNLARVFNGLTAVAGISFRINKGELFGLLGPNGAGKTTTNWHHRHLDNTLHV